MWTISELKERGKAAFKANYWNSVIVAVLLSLLAGGAGASAKGETNAEELQSSLMMLDPLALQIFFGGLMTVSVIAFLLRIFVFNPLQVGGYRFFKKNVEEGYAPLGTIGEGFSDYGRIFITLLLRDVFLALWSCLFIIPGIVKSYSYRMVPYIIKDNPELSATEVITRSRELMNGNKWRAFVLDLSFLGWIILGAITCEIVGIFWTNPYIQNTNAALYLELSKNQQY